VYEWHKNKCFLTIGEVVGLIVSQKDKLADILAEHNLSALTDQIKYKYLDKKPTDLGYDGDDSVSEDEDFSYAPKEQFYQLTLDISANIQCLVNLQDTYEMPVVDIADEKHRDIKLKVRSPPDWWSERISARFPDAATSLVTFLGEENWKRYRRCIELPDIQHEDVSDAPIQAMTVTGTQFHDSGLGTSVPSVKSKRSYADTITSFGHLEGRVIRIPQLPEQGRQGKPFTCLICEKTVHCFNKSSWKSVLAFNILLSALMKTVESISFRICNRTLASFPPVSTQSCLLKTGMSGLNT
jgi:hypothetical protein